MAAATPSPDQAQLNRCLGSNGLIVAAPDRQIPYEYSPHRRTVGARMRYEDREECVYDQLTHVRGKNSMQQERTCVRDNIE